MKILAVMRHHRTNVNVMKWHVTVGRYFVFADSESAALFAFGKSSQLFGVDVLELLQLPLSSPVQIFNVHHVRLFDAGVLPELVSDAGQEPRLVPPGPEELSVQRQDLLLQLAVPRHPRCQRKTPEAQRAFFQSATGHQVPLWGKRLKSPSEASTWNTFSVDPGGLWFAGRQEAQNNFRGWMQGGHSQGQCAVTMVTAPVKLI